MFPDGMFFNRFLMDEAGDGDGGGGGGAGDGGTGDAGQGGEGDKGGDPGGQSNDPQGGQGGSGEPDDSNWDEGTKSYISSLRKENAKYRTSAKETADRLKALEEQAAQRDKALKAALGIEEDDEIPVEKRLEASQHQSASLEFQNGVLRMALENGITGDGVEYMQFLIEKEMGNLGDDEELSDEALDNIITKAKSMGGGAAPNKTSVNKNGSGGDGQGGDPPPSNGGDTLSAEDFANMSFTQKGQLFGKNPDLYKKLNAEATQKGLL